MDVLLTSAVREQAVQLDRLAVAQANVASYQSCFNTIGCMSPNTAHERWRWMCFDSPIDVRCDNTNVVCVFDSSTYVVGRCCQWTVPAGATRARFEVWGPGSSGGSGGNCCGYTPWGTSGAFLAFTLNVTPGCQYTLCAGSSSTCYMSCCGCATSAFSCGADHYSSNCPSFITGFGLGAASAPGGRWDLIGHMAAMFCSQGIACTRANINRWGSSHASSHGSGACICGNASICHQSQCTCGVIPPQGDWDVRPSVCFTNCSVLPFTIPIMYQGGNYSTDGYFTPLLVPPYPKCGWRTTAADDCNNSHMFLTEQVGFCGSACTPCGSSLRTCCCCMPIPGLGGGPAAMYGGCTAGCGELGRNGMVKVIFC